MPINTFIHEYVPATDANAPTLLLLHGTGGDEFRCFPSDRSLLPVRGCSAHAGTSLREAIRAFSGGRQKASSTWKT